jgi:hypothetical protein
MTPVPLTHHLGTVELTIGSTLVRGTGTVHLTSPSGPILDFQGTVPIDDYKSAIGWGEGSNGPAATLMVAPRHGFEGSGGGYRLEGVTVTPVWSNSELSDEGVKIRARYSAKLCIVRPEATQDPTGPTHIDVHYLGLPSRRIRHPILKGAPVGAATVVRDGDHTFFVHQANGWFQREMVGWDVGGFTYQGPLRVSDEAFMSPAVWQFSMLLGCALGTPIDPIGFVEADAEGRLIEARWWRPWKDHQRKPLWPPLAGDGESWKDATNVVTLVEAGLARWGDLEAKHFGLELALLYLEKAPSQPRSEMRMRDLIIALERILRGQLRTKDVVVDRRAGLHKIFAKFNESAGWDVFSDSDIDAYRKIRNALSHLGDLADNRDFSLDETQSYSLTEGAILTACIRAIAAVLDIDIQLHDLGDINLPRRSSRAGPFAVPLVVPGER